MKSRTSRAGNEMTRRRWLWMGGAVVLLLVILGLRYVAGSVLSGPALTELVIPGPLVHVQPQAVRAAVLPILGNGFFNTDVEQIQAAVQAVPWVASAAVRRSWPHTLYIEITEEVPVARWNGDGLMDAQGRVFVHSTDKIWATLPMLMGPEGSAPEVLAEFNSFVSLLAQRGLTIVQLTLDARGAASVELSNGIEVRLGREAAQQRLERFAAVALPTLGAKLADVAYVDMRYTNGFAVGWANPGASPACQWHAGPGQRSSPDGRAGGRTRDGSQNACTTPAVGHSNEVRPNV